MMPGAEDPDHRAELDEANRARMAELATIYLTAPRLRQLAEFGSLATDLQFDAAQPGPLILAITDYAREIGKLSEWMQVLVTDSIIMPECREFFLKFLVQPSYYQVLTGTGVFIEWEHFGHYMTVRGAQICRISFTDDPQRYGTGFLVGPDLVLTAHHVIDKYLDKKGLAKPGSGRKIQCCFDFKLDIDAKSTSGTTVPVDAEDWLVFAAKGHKGEDKSFSDTRKVKPADLDFALIRLEEDFANTAHPVVKGKTRGYIELPDIRNCSHHLEDLRTELGQKPQILIGQHPGGNRLLLSVGAFTKFCCNDHRMQYKVSTLQGSSGAPCFDTRWQVVGMHHIGYENVKVNQAVPIDCIASEIARRQLLARPLPAYDSFGAVLRDGTLLFPRPKLIEAVQRMLAPDDPRRILIIEGLPGSGRTICARFAQEAALERHDEVLRWDAEAIQSISPEEFAERFVGGIETLAGKRAADSANKATPKAMPKRPEDRQPARWVAHSLSAWVAQRVSDSVAVKVAGADAGNETEQHEPSVWLVIEQLDRFKLQPETHDLLRALMQTPQSTEVAALKRLKLVLVGYSGETAGVDADEISRYPTIPEDVNAGTIKHCMISAYRRYGEAFDSNEIDRTVELLEPAINALPPATRLIAIASTLQSFAERLSRSTTGRPSAANG